MPSLRPSPSFCSKYPHRQLELTASLHRRLLEPAPWTELADSLGKVAARQEELFELYERKIHSDQGQSRTLEVLHDQLRDYKQNFVRDQVKPLLRDLTFCYDFAAEEADRARAAATSGGPPPSADETAKGFDHLRQMIGDVLSKYDIDAFRSDSDAFDQKTQQCVRTVPTGVEADHKKVAAVGAVGFRSGDLIVRKEQVTVYKYVAGHAPAPTAPAPASTPEAVAIETP